ncbi:ribosome silencing factor [Mycobacterium uberis]|uniref:Ribosomal silencing factor RsfS n=1 Tax=Mycobacterium uberis TaxID=2162698 RepID=A0A3E1HL83_9MYCO|nr:ribosome silencing factor [Mycobacterium uberis]RFD27107.1 ribosome silencing factor [Mycobacterium uberis]
MSATKEAIGMSMVAAAAAAEKLSNVVAIDLSEQLGITGCFGIASVSNERQVNAIVDEVEEKMCRAGHRLTHREGAREGHWTLLDYCDIMVHIQHQDDRDFYAPGRLWGDFLVVPVDISRDSGQSASS